MSKDPGPGSRSARASNALGRFLVPAARALSAALLATVVAAAIACAGGPRAVPEEPRADRMAFPPVSRGPSSPSAEARASSLLAEARSSLAAGELEAAERAAERVISEFPTVTGSGEALWIRARAALELGDAGVAAEAAARLRALLPDDHGLAVPTRLVEGRALAGTDRARPAVDALLPIPPSAPDSVRRGALDVVRRAVTGLSMADLEALAPGSPPGWPRLRAPILAELALALHARSREEEATRAARDALSLSDRGPEAVLARSVLADEVTVERRRTVRLGAVLPAGGSPGQQEYATLVEEGIRARLEAELRGGAVPVELQLRDHQGRAGAAADLVRELTTDDAAGVVGPLSDGALAEAARARSRPVPMVSPTARNLPGDQVAVYSLGGPDPGAPRALARYAADRSLREAVIVHPGSPTATFEAETFAEEFRRLGGRVLRTLEYPRGSTFFREPLEAVRELQPAALVLPIPASDVELLAPQVTYFGLDTLGIQVLGTADWVQPGVLEAVEPRHTDGVVVATPRRPGRESDARARFVEAYEGLFQKTLRSPVPALGYDAASLLLEAFRTGARSPAEVRRAFEGIQGFPGATGTISIREGRIVREHFLVRLRNREMIPIRMDFDDGSDPP